MEAYDEQDDEDVKPEFFEVEEEPRDPLIDEYLCSAEVDDEPPKRMKLEQPEAEPDRDICREDGYAWRSAVNASDAQVALASENPDRRQGASIVPSPTPRPATTSVPNPVIFVRFATVAKYQPIIVLPGGLAVRPISDLNDNLVCSPGQAIAPASTAVNRDPVPAEVSEAEWSEVPVPAPKKREKRLTVAQTEETRYLMKRLRTLTEENAALVAERESLTAEVKTSTSPEQNQEEAKKPISSSRAARTPQERRFSFAMLTVCEAGRICPLSKATVFQLGKLIKERNLIKQKPDDDYLNDPALTVEDKIFITVTKLRKYSPFEVLSVYWNFPKETIVSAVEEMLPVLHEVMYMRMVRERGIPTLEDNGGSVPEEFQKMPMCQFLADCTDKRVHRLGKVYKPSKECDQHSCQHDLFKIVVGYIQGGLLVYVKKPMLDEKRRIVEDEPNVASTATGLHPDAVDLIEKGVWLRDVMTLCSRRVPSGELPPAPKFKGKPDEDAEALISSNMLHEAKSAMGRFVNTLRSSEALGEPWYHSDPAKRAMLVDLCVAVVSMKKPPRNQKKGIHETSGGEEKNEDQEEDESGDTDSR